MANNSFTAAVEDVLQQGLTLLNGVDGETYARPIEGASLGTHYRHVLDHFLCLREGIRTGEVNYDHRRRDPRLENSTEYARLVTQQLIEEFQEFSPETFRGECIVTYTVGYGEDEPGSVPSNLAREITFCVGHAIHHYAILKLLAAGAGVKLPCEFGVAPSTLKHRESEAHA
ncbi:MAG TPA: hypothetical protein VH088_11100 [Terriglobales bacterium]|jgi:hypothetical protein|nr:hypothetical protein [Terriglobales bacterium]